MKCYFCQKELKQAPQNGSVTIPALCFNHKANVLHKFGQVSGQLMMVSYFTRAGKKEYEVDLRLYELRTVISIVKHFKYSDGPPAVGVRSWRDGDGFSAATLVRSFDGILDISPENAHVRIPTILVFS